MELKAGMTGHPILFHATLEELGVRIPLPYVDPEFFPKLWGDRGEKRRIKSWGHLNGKSSAHWVSTRHGTVMHIDLGFPRYAFQLQLFNGGFVVHGEQDDLTKMPLFRPGLVSILDTHSPHQVSRDPRLPNISDSKLAVGVDLDHMPDVRAVLPELLAKMKRWANEQPGKRARAYGYAS